MMVPKAYHINTAICILFLIKVYISDEYPFLESDIIKIILLRVLQRRLLKWSVDLIEKKMTNTLAVNPLKTISWFNRKKED